MPISLKRNWRKDSATRSRVDHEREKRLEKSIQEKKKQAEKLEKVSSKKKKQQIRPDRLSSSKQKDSVQKAIQKNAKTLERRLQK